MRRALPVGAGSHQILDTATGTLSLNAAAVGFPLAQGTIWPLLPDTAYRIYNVSADFLPSVSKKLVVSAITIFVELLNSAGQIMVGFDIATANYPDKTFAVDGGPNLSKAGDPIIEFFSNLAIVGSNILAPGPAVSFQMNYGADFENTDSGAQTITVAGECIFSSVSFR